MPPLEAIPDFCPNALSPSQRGRLYCVLALADSWTKDRNEAKGDGVKLALVCLAAGVLIGYIFGGRLRNLIDARLRWAGVALAGLVLQLAPLPGPLAGVAFPLLVASHAILIAFVMKNIRSPGFALILVGVILNLVVIAANRGMPVTRQALVAANDRAGLAELRQPGRRYHLAGPHDTLIFLSDAIGTTRPFELIISVGDIWIYLGGVAFVARAMSRKKPQPLPRPLQELPVEGALR